MESEIPRSLPNKVLSVQLKNCDYNNKDEDSSSNKSVHNNGNSSSQVENKLQDSLTLW